MPIQKKRKSTSIDTNAEIDTSKPLSGEEEKGDGGCGSGVEEGAPARNEPTTLPTPEPEQGKVGDYVVSSTQERLARFKALQARAVSAYTLHHTSRPLLSKMLTMIEKCGGA